MENAVRNFVSIDSIYGPFLINRHCALQAEALIKTGRPHIQPELDAMMQIVDQLPDGCVAVDGGANAGLVCVPLAHRIKARGGQVHAFEPQRTIYYGLCGTVALNQLDNLFVYNMGLASRNAAMVVPTVDYGADSDFGTVSLAMAGDEGAEVPVVRLDGLGLARLDFLKLDIEGMEIDALRGAKQLIRTHRPWCWIEYWKTGEQPVMAELAGLDYEFYKMDSLNLLCVPRSRWNRQSLHINGTPLAIDSESPGALVDLRSSSNAFFHTLHIYKREGEWGRAIEHCRGALGKGLKDFDLQISMADSFDFAGLPEAGLRILEQIDQQDTLPIDTLAEIHRVRSWLLARAGRYQESARERAACEQVTTAPRYAEMGLPLEKQLAQQSLTGKRLLVMGYGGNGDQIHYARYLHALRPLGCSAITVVASSALASLLQHSFPNIEFVAGAGRYPNCTALPAFDYWCSFLTLATTFGFNPHPEGMPDAPAYLSLPDSRVAQWRTWRADLLADSPGLLLGLNWQGVPATDAAFSRASSLRDFAPLATLADTQCFCINRDLQPSLDAASASIIYPAERVADFCDLGALTQMMDILVTTCTAQVHLAGALGIPTILLLGPMADARWRLDRTTDLYPSVRIVRSTRRGQWDDGIEQAIALVNAFRLLQRWPL